MQLVIEQQLGPGLYEIRIDDDSKFRISDSAAIWINSMHWTPKPGDRYTLTLFPGVESHLVQRLAMVERNVNTDIPKLQLAIEKLKTEAEALRQQVKQLHIRVKGLMKNG